MMSDLQKRAWRSMVILAVGTGALLFLPAGTMRYWQGWIYLLIFTAASALTTTDLLRRDPKLLERRLKGGPAAENRPVQRVVMLLLSLGFAALLVVPALDHRFGWSMVPLCVAIAGQFLVVAGFALVARVFRENTYSSATIEVADGQTVIATGPYAVVRHPMYASALLYLLGTPLALGSCWGLVVFAAIVPLLLWRLSDEERFLAEHLPGYTAYQRQVRFRLLPFVW